MRRGAAIDFAKSRAACEHFSQVCVCVDVRARVDPIHPSIQGASGIVWASSHTICASLRSLFGFAMKQLGGLCEQHLPFVAVCEVAEDHHRRCHRRNVSVLRINRRTVGIYN